MTISSILSIPFFRIPLQISAHNSTRTCWGHEVVVDEAKMDDDVDDDESDDEVKSEVDRRTALTNADSTEGDGRLGKEREDEEEEEEASCVVDSERQIN